MELLSLHGRAWPIKAESLLDIHERAQESLRRLMVFCGSLTDDELGRPIPGFGFPTVLRQLEHTIGAEVYWQTVVTRGYTEEATPPYLPSTTRARSWLCAARSANRTRRTISTIQ